jgi:SAM-dependent methyltransferase
MSIDEELIKVKSFFDEKAKTHGPVFQSGDWNSLERQNIMFQQLLKIWSNSVLSASIIDFGCGYGALLDFLKAENYKFSEYVGYDFSKCMIENAIQKHEIQKSIIFTSRLDELPLSDYVIAAGIFAKKMEALEDDWKTYCLNTLNQLWALSKKGMAFNSLTIYSDREKMRPDLYYADPCFLFDYCKKNFSRNVSLLHDYNLYEFTILVRR